MQLPQSSDLCGNRDLLGLYFVQGEVLPATVLAANAVPREPGPNWMTEVIPEGEERKDVPEQRSSL